MDGTRDTAPRAMPGVLAWLVMAVIALGIAGYAIYRPAGNADLIEYIAVVDQWEGAIKNKLAENVDVPPSTTSRCSTPRFWRTIRTG